jgi:hypothetical protein
MCGNVRLDTICLAQMSSTSLYCAWVHLEVLMLLDGHCNNDGVQA